MRSLPCYLAPLLSSATLRALINLNIFFLNPGCFKFGVSSSARARVTVRGWELSWAGSGLYDQFVLYGFDRFWRNFLVYSAAPLSETRVSERAASVLASAFSANALSKPWRRGQITLSELLRVAGALFVTLAWLL